MDAWLVDLRYAVRSLVLRPGFAAVVVLTMAVGIGANVAAFAYLAYFTWPTIEAPAAKQLVWIDDPTPEDPVRGLTYPDFRALEGLPETTQLGAFRLLGTSVRTRESNVHAWGSAVSGNYFALFGARPQLGRLLGPEDDRPGAPRVLVVNDPFWRRHLGGDPAVVGRTVELDGKASATIVGVTRPGFQGPGLATGLYLPLATAEPVVSNLADPASHSLSVLARRRAGSRLAALDATLDSRAAALDESAPAEKPRNFSARPIEDSAELWEGDPLARGARVLAATVGLLLLLACANVANLMLARAAARRREIAVQAALGASRLRLARRLLIEALVLAVAGGGLGLLLARQALRTIEDYLVRSVPVGMGDWGLGTTLVLDLGRLGLFFAAVTVGTALLFGLAPVLQTWRLDLVTALKVDAGGSVGGGGSIGAGKLSTRRLLLATQIAISTVLLIAAALLVRTLAAASSRDPGFAVEGRMVATLHAPQGTAADREQSAATFRQLLERAHELPGVRSATLAWRLPASFISPEAVTLVDGVARQVSYNVVGPGYFETLAIPLLQGRALEERDDREAPGAIAVNQRAVAELWGGRSPLGETVRIEERGEERTFTVVGVVADSLYAAPSQPLGPCFYYAYGQRFRARMTLIVDAAGPIAAPLDALVRRGWRELSVVDLQPLSEQLRRGVNDQRMNADFAGAIGVFGLLLATLGVFSVTSYATSRRRREIALRLALGADRGRVRRWVTGEAARSAAWGIALGSVAAWALVRLLAGVLYGVDTHDPISFAVVPLVLLAASVGAAALPAIRAARIEPAQALRQE